MHVILAQGYILVAYPPHTPFVGLHWAFVVSLRTGHANLLTGHSLINFNFFALL